MSFVVAHGSIEHTRSSTRCLASFLIFPFWRCANDDENACSRSNILGAFPFVYWHSLDFRAHFLSRLTVQSSDKFVSSAYSTTVAFEMRSNEGWDKASTFCRSHVIESIGASHLRGVASEDGFFFFFSVLRYVALVCARTATNIYTYSDDKYTASEDAPITKSRNRGDHCPDQQFDHSSNLDRQ